MEDSALQFARPYWLYAGVAFCVLAVWLWAVFDRRREADLARLVHPRFRARLLPGESAGLRRIKRWLWLPGLLLLCVAAAGPQKGFEFREIRQRGIDILFAVDTSRSMLAEDLSPNRLERARMGMQDFVDRLQGDRVGLIPFAGSSFALCPLTTDYDAFRESLRALETDLIPRQGTDVASAIREADRLFTEQKNNHRILVLMTDGEDFQGDVEDAVDEAKEKGMTIHTIGVGSAEGGRIPAMSQAGYKDFVRDDAGNIVQTKLDEATLRKIAEATGGLYAPLGRGADGLEMIYREKLRLVPQDEREARMEKIPVEHFVWPLAAGLLLLLLEFLLPERRRAVKVRALPSAARRHATVVGVLTLFAVSGFETVRAAEDPRELYNQGTAAYEAGDFQKSADSLRASLHTTDLQLQSRAYYNLGNALYRLGQAAKEESPEQSWESAVKAYDDALALNPADEDARFNRDLVKRKLEELKKQQDQKDGKDGEDSKEEKDKEQQEDQKDGKDGQDSKEKQEQEDQQKEGDQKKEGDQQKEGEEKKDGQQQSGGEEKKDEQKEGAGQQSDEKKEGKEGQEQPGEKKEGKEGEEQQAQSGEQKDGEKKDATAASGEGEKKDGENKEEASAAEERRKPGEMTEAEARQLLQALRREERTVIPLDRPDPRMRRFKDPANATKGKTW